MVGLLKFNSFYFGLALLIFVIEILIAMFAHDQIIRPYFGDVLVVILIYSFIKAFLIAPVIKTAVLVLLFSFTIETLRYFYFIKWIGLKNSAIARLVLGDSFAWMDILAYIIGIAIVIWIENVSGHLLQPEDNKASQAKYRANKPLYL